MRRILSFITAALLLGELLAPGIVHAQVAVTIPIVFVPGYGASINVAQLAQLSPQPTLSGWHFFSSLTPSYTTFLQDLDNYGVPYAVAYYDWRLPAETAATEYLRPAIEAAKQKYHTDKVNLVAHSFGGLVSRAYIQGNEYQGDVASLVELGTPDYGAPEAYGAWEGGQLPDGWDALGLLIRYYQHIDKKKPTVTQALRTYFPSAKELLPVRSGVLIGANGKEQPLRCQTNDWLANLDVHMLDLITRVRVVAEEGVGIPTLAKLTLGKSDCRKTMWPDGEVTATDTDSGDGTVPLADTFNSDVPRLEYAKALHADLPAVLETRALSALYPGLIPSEDVDQSLSWVRPLLTFLAFMFDCPVSVAIALPDGEVIHSDQPSPIVEEDSSADLTWMNVPKQEGSYLVTVTALADTPVTAWVGSGPDLTLSLKRGQSASWSVDSTTLAATSIPKVVNPSPAPASPKAATVSSPSAQEENLVSQTPEILPSASPAFQIGDVGPVVQRLAVVLTTLPRSDSLSWIHIPLLGEPISQPQSHILSWQEKLRRIVHWPP